MSETVAQAYWHDLLPKLGTAEEYLAARRLFESCGFTYERVCARLGVEHLYKFRTEPPGLGKDDPAATPLDALIRLFAFGLYLERDMAEKVLTAEGLKVLEALNLLAPDPARPGAVFGTVALVPVPGALTASDRVCAPDGSQFGRAPDGVYPAFFANTLTFVERLPETRCETMLELGTGTGFAAIRSAPWVSHIWATDVAARSVRFSAFNAGLAGLGNVSVLEGDMYAPVEGMTFDRIAIHPPYMPSPDNKFICRDGGEDGEQIFRRAVEGLPSFLRPNGRFYSVLMASDRRGETLEQRIRKWLGPDEAGFDVVIVTDERNAVEDALAKASAENQRDAPFWRSIWERNQTESLLYGSVLIHRHSGERAKANVRAQAGVGFNWRHLDGLLDWEIRVRQPGAEQMLLECRPRIAAGCELQVSYRLVDGRLTPYEALFEVTGALRTRFKSPLWLVEAIFGCDGKASWRDRYTALVAEGRIPPQAPAAEFARMLVALVSGGALVVE
ncbi:MAG: methyltransferase [Bryobacteraceae bacterium]|jgi:SAM-dependent methyltransferase